MAKPIPKERQDDMLTTIKAEELSGAEAARRYGINVNNTSRWLADGVRGTPNQVLELNCLQREYQQRKHLIGQLLLDREWGKRLSWGGRPCRTARWPATWALRASRSYTRKRDAIDEKVKRQIEAVMHPAYGHKRIALPLKLEHNRVRRVMQKDGLQPPRCRPTPSRKPKD